MIIDAHHHLWNLTRGYPWLDRPHLKPIRQSFTLDDLHAVIRPAGVARTVLVEAGRGESGQALEFLATADTADEIAGVVAWADVTAPDLADTLDRYQSARGDHLLVGVRSQVQGQPDPDYLHRADVRRELDTIAKADLAYDLIIRPNHLPSAVAVAAAVPNCRLVLDHCGKPPIAAGQLEPWTTHIRRLAERPNVTCKLSGLVTQADPEAWTVNGLRPYVDTVLELFGPERLMFGSDWPVCLLGASHEQVVAATRQLIGELSGSEQAAIWAGTTTRVYRLEE